MFRKSYNWDGPPGDYINIDAFIPGCPPKPEAIIAGVVKVVAGLRSGALVPGCLTQPDLSGQLVPANAETH
jgi:NADH:ubiquinone oxidoreductase subunit B-like Fe-S oxidoreductase